MQLCLHKIPRDLKYVWDEMCGRDNAHPEISQIGIQSTKHDLRQRSEVYRRKKDKRLYVESLQQGRLGKKSRLNLAANSEQNVCSDFQPNSLPTKESIPPGCTKSQDIDLENSGPSVSTNNSNPSVSSDNLAPLQISTTSHVRRLPESLMDFEKFCGENNIRHKKVYQSYISLTSKHFYQF